VNSSEGILKLFGIRYIWNIPWSETKFLCKATNCISPNIVPGNTKFFESRIFWDTANRPKQKKKWKKLEDTFMVV
jgi:hypothetical protein